MCMRPELWKPITSLNYLHLYLGVTRVQIYRNLSPNSPLMSQGKKCASGDHPDAKIFPMSHQWPSWVQPEAVFCMTLLQFKRDAHLSVGKILNHSGQVQIHDPSSSSQTLCSFPFCKCISYLWKDSIKKSRRKLVQVPHVQPSSSQICRKTKSHGTYFRGQYAELKDGMVMVMFL